MLCVPKGCFCSKSLLQYEVERACVDSEQLASMSESEDRVCVLEEQNCTIVELHGEKQQLVAHSKVLEEEVARLTDKLTEVSVGPAAGRLSKKEIDDLRVTYYWVFL